MQRYEVGDAVVLETTVKVDGALTDATVVLDLTHLDSGTVTQPTVDHTGLGRYRATPVVDQVGEWTAIWTISGPCIGVQSDSFFVREPAVMLCEVSDVEDAARVAQGSYSSDDTERAAVEAAIIGISARVIGACQGRQFVRREYTESFWVSGDSDEITLTQRPVVSVSAVVLDGVTLIAGTDYDLQSYILRRLSWRPWGLTSQWSFVEVTYRGGFLVIPDDIVDLVARRVAGRTTNPEGLRQYSIGSFSATVSTEQLEGTGWSPAEEATLRRYGASRPGLLRVGH